MNEYKCECVSTCINDNKTMFYPKVDTSLTTIFTYLKYANIHFSYPLAYIYQIKFDMIKRLLFCNLHQRETIIYVLVSCHPITIIPTY